MSPRRHEPVRIQTYTLVEGGVALLCLRCGATCRDFDDVALKQCSACGTFHHVVLPRSYAVLLMLNRALFLIAKTRVPSEIVPAPDPIFQARAPIETAKQMVEAACVLEALRP